jgi:hypothetical protein
VQRAVPSVRIGSLRRFEASDLDAWREARLAFVATARATGEIGNGGAPPYFLGAAVRRSPVANRRRSPFVTVDQELRAREVLERLRRPARRAGPPTPTVLDDVDPPSSALTARRFAGEEEPLIKPTKRGKRRRTARPAGA